MSNVFYSGREEKEVDIYQTVGDVDPPPRRGTLHDVGGTRKSLLCMGALVLLLLAGVAMVTTYSVFVTLEKNWFQKENEDLNFRFNQLQDSLTGRQCPAGWSGLGCSCYLKVNKSLSWSEARKRCRERGADLVVVHSQQEQNLVWQLSGTGWSWIGLRNKHRYNNTWTWVDGSATTQTFWTAEEPQVFPLTHAACCDDQGLWRKTFFSTELSAICEMQSSGVVKSDV